MKDARKIFPSLIISIGFVAVGIKTIIRGIDEHTTWRIVVASIGVSFFIFLLILCVSWMIRNSKKVA